MVDYRRVKPLGNRIFAEVLKPPLSDILHTPDIWGGSYVRVLASGSEIAQPEQELVIDREQAVVLAGGYDSGTIVVFTDDAIVAFPVNNNLVAAPGWVDVIAEPPDSPLFFLHVATPFFRRISDDCLLIAKPVAGLCLRYMSKDYRYLAEGDILCEVDE